MPLNRLSNYSFISEKDGVRFGMLDQKDHHAVLCLLTHQALIDVFGASDRRQWEGMFVINREVVEAVASEMYDDHEDRALVRLTTRDLEPKNLVVSAVSALNAHSLSAAVGSVAPAAESDAVDSVVSAVGDFVDE
jgi:Protein of unknown function (DUF1488)